MSATIPDEYRDLVGPPVIPVLGTLNADGTVQVTPVWATYDGEHILVGSARGRLKDRNMRARRAVTLTFVDPANPYRYVELRGDAQIAADPDYEFAKKLGAKYGGADLSEHDGPGVQRLIVTIVPTRVTVWGDAAE